MHRFLKGSVERFVVGCLVHVEHADLEALERSYSDLDDAAIFDCARRNRVASIVGSRLSALLGSRLAAHWKNEIEQVYRHNRARYDELDRVAAVLAREGIKLVALKNGGIARAIYPHLAECPMGDLDVLVDKASFHRAHAILASEGFELGFMTDQPIHEATLEAGFREGGTEYLKDVNGVTLCLELQWRPVAGRWIRPDQEPRSSDLIARSLEISGTDVRILCPEDNILQVALHTAKHTYVRAPGVRLHTDVDRITRGCDIDWQAVVETTVALQTKTAVYFSLAFARELLGSPVPSWVLERLRPGAVKRELMTRMLLRAGLLDPDERKFGKYQYILFVMLLYDGLSGLRKGILPDWAWMQEHYGIRRRIELPFYYGKRILNLALRRVGKT